MTASERAGLWATARLAQDFLKGLDQDPVEIQMEFTDERAMIQGILDRSIERLR